MTTCHGPGCQRPQKVPYWCSEECQSRWDARWGKRLPDQMPGFLTGAVADHMPDVYDAIRAALGSVAPLAPELERVKLTRDQIDVLRPHAPTPTGLTYGSVYGGGIGALTGIPIDLVETVEESTPYQLGTRPSPFATGGLIAPTDRTPFLDENRDCHSRGPVGRWLVRMFGGQS